MTFLLEFSRAKSMGDVLAGEREAFATPESFLNPESFGNTIRVEFLPFDFFFASGSLKRLPLRMARRFFRRGRNPNYSIAFDPAVFKFAQARQYSVIVGVDAHGIVLADNFNQWAKKPLVYISFEILFGEDVDGGLDQDLYRAERAACGRTSLVLIQDQERAEAFCRETCFPSGRVLLRCSSASSSGRREIRLATKDSENSPEQANRPILWQSSKLVLSRRASRNGLLLAR